MLLLIIKYAKTLFRPPLTDHWLVEKHKLLRKSIYIYKKVRNKRNSGSYASKVATARF